MKNTIPSCSHAANLDWNNFERQQNGLMGIIYYEGSVNEEIPANSEFSQYLVNELNIGYYDEHL